MSQDAKSRGTSYRFGLFEADSRSGELRKQGRRLRLRGRPFDILILLLARPGDVVSRDELRQHLWPADTFVDFDHGLNSAMNRLREALGDSAENPHFIETLPKRGYRFIAPVGVVPPDAPAPGSPASSDWRSAVPVPDAPAIDTAVASAGASPQTMSMPSRVVLALATAALVAAVVVAALYLRIDGPAPPASARMTLAVLPFENLSSDIDQEYLSDGFTEEMIAEIGKLDPQHLGVIARTTTMLYKGARKSVGQITNELGVDYVLEGSIRRVANRVRITAQLIQTSDMTHLWAETYDRDLADVLAIQSEVAMKIAQSLTLALNPPREEVGRTAAPFSPAYELTLRGRFFRDQATEESARKAIEHFERAIALDPEYAPAHAGLADAYWLLGAPGWEVERPADTFDRAEQSAERALALDPQSAEAHAVLGKIRLSYDWDVAAAARELQEAIRLDPSYAQAHQYYATTWLAMRRFDEAIAEARRAMELDPLSAQAGTTLGIIEYYAGHDAEAIAEFMKTLEITPDFAVAHWGLAQAHRRRGETARELEELRRAVELSGRSAYMRAHLAYGLARAGRRDEALALQQELEEEGRGRYGSPYHFALIAAGRGDMAAAVEWLERAHANRSGWMILLPVVPAFEAVRDQPAIRRLLAGVTPRS